MSEKHQPTVLKYEIIGHFVNVVTFGTCLFCTWLCALYVG